VYKETVRERKEERKKEIRNRTKNNKEVEELNKKVAGWQLVNLPLCNSKCTQYNVLWLAIMFLSTSSVP
jgi:hypothetical protein